MHPPPAYNIRTIKPESQRYHRVRRTTDHTLFFYCAKILCESPHRLNGGLHTLYKSVVKKSVLLHTVSTVASIVYIDGNAIYCTGRCGLSPHRIMYSSRRNKKSLTSHFMGWISLTSRVGKLAAENMRLIRNGRFSFGKQKCKHKL